MHEMFKCNSKNTINFFSTFKMMKTMFGIHKVITNKKTLGQFPQEKKSYKKN